MRVFFLSDLHLADGSTPGAARLEKFLREIPESRDCVVLGGDIFDLFVGDKAVFRLKFQGVLDALRSLAESGAMVYYLEGNHDFHMSGVFAGIAGVQVMTDEFHLEASDRRIWVSHGDMIDPEDRGYRLLRAVTRHFLFRFLLRILPGNWIDAIGRRSSQESRKYNNEDRVSAADKERLRQLYLAYARKKVKEGAQHVLIGHSHLRDQVEIKEPEGEGEYLNLGFSSETLLYARLDKGFKRFEIQHFS